VRIEKFCDVKARRRAQTAATRRWQTEGFLYEQSRPSQQVQLALSFEQDLSRSACRQCVRLQVEADRNLQLEQWLVLLNDRSQLRVSPARIAKGADTEVIRDEHDGYDVALDGQKPSDG